VTQSAASRSAGGSDRAGHYGEARRAGIAFLSARLRIVSWKPACGGVYSPNEESGSQKFRFRLSRRYCRRGRLSGPYRAGHAAGGHPTRRPWNGGLPDRVHRGRAICAVAGQMTFDADRRISIGKMKEAAN
jgi:hypothetical protein